jgi:hypothetical protein
MRYLARFLQFWWEFIVGDDWRVAVGVGVALFATWSLSHHGFSVWWLLPLATAIVLVLSVLREVRHGE